MPAPANLASLRLIDSISIISCCVRDDDALCTHRKISSSSEEHSTTRSCQPDSHVLIYCLCQHQPIYFHGSRPSSVSVRSHTLIRPHGTHCPPTSTTLITLTVSESFHAGDPFVWKTWMSGNLTAVREMSGILLKVREMSEKILSGKSGLKLFIVSCIFASIQVFSRIAHWASLCRRPQCWRAKGASATLKEKRRYLVGVCSVLSIKYMVLDHPVLHSYPHH